MLLELYYKDYEMHGLEITFCKIRDYFIEEASIDNHLIN